MDKEEVSITAPSSPRVLLRWCDMWAVFSYSLLENHFILTDQKILFIVPSLLSLLSLIFKSSESSEGSIIEFVTRKSFLIISLH